MIGLSQRPMSPENATLRLWPSAPASSRIEAAPKMWPAGMNAAETPAATSTGSANGTRRRSGMTASASLTVYSGTSGKRLLRRSAVCLFFFCSASSSWIRAESAITMPAISAVAGVQ